MQIARIIREVASDLASKAAGSQPINGLITLKRAIQDSGQSELRSAELAEQWRGRLIQELEACLEEWDLLGVPRPLIETDAPATFLPFGHSQYEAKKEPPKLNPNFADVCSFVDSLTSREFLLVPLCLLHATGCDPIVITEGSRDEGVDCVGRVKLGPTRSTCIFAQSKTSKSKIEVDSIRVDFDKFRTLQKRARFIEYLAAVGNDTSIDGRTICYLFFANTEFSNSSRYYAREEGLLLRSRRQAAFWLSQSFEVGSLSTLRIKLGPTLKRDLTRNIAPLISEYIRESV